MFPNYCHHFRIPNYVWMVWFQQLATKTLEKT